MQRFIGVALKRTMLERMVVPFMLTEEAFSVLVQKNKAETNGGSAVVHHSRAVIIGCVFKEESAKNGYGGSIYGGNVANVTIHDSIFLKCSANRGGSLSSLSETILSLFDLTINSSAASSGGGGIYCDHKSVLTASNLSVHSSRSAMGGAMAFDGRSVATLEKNLLSGNVAHERGGGLYCQGGSITVERGILEANTASKFGGGFYLDNCHSIIDNVTLTLNNASVYGGGVYSRGSKVEMHNIKGMRNHAGSTGNTIVATYRSVYSSRNTHLMVPTSSLSANEVVIANSSTGEIEHVNIIVSGSNVTVNCSIVVIGNSHVTVTSLYHSHDVNPHSEKLSEKQLDVCDDESSTVTGVSAGM